MAETHSVRANMPYFIVESELGALGASRYKGSTEGINALSCSIRVSPEG